ncbi:hypothetical protein CEXT_243651 [Caerostris extrusa]|uniref:Uncharacterized protein n=1 Tax=Caerostris extrusa TaxID=172846 RepID=A0AAV4RRW6_CAEEX|nr:hypothetical protein CEXT_243651 [Caerostris extrusa]
MDSQSPLASKLLTSPLNRKSDLVTALTFQSGLKKAQSGVSFRPRGYLQTLVSLRPVDRVAGALTLGTIGFDQDLIRPALRSIRNFRACRDSKPAPYNLNRKILQTGQRLAVPNQKSTLLIEVYNLIIPSDWKINKNRTKGETLPVKTKEKKRKKKRKEKKNRTTSPEVSHSNTNQRSTKPKRQNNRTPTYGVNQRRTKTKKKLQLREQQFFFF